MSKTVQIRDIEDEVYAALVRRAADEGITVVPLLVNFGAETFKAGVELSSERATEVNGVTVLTLIAITSEQPFEQREKLRERSTVDAKNQAGHQRRVGVAECSGTQHTTELAHGQLAHDAVKSPLVVRAGSVVIERPDD